MSSPTSSRAAYESATASSASFRRPEITPPILHGTAPAELRDQPFSADLLEIVPGQVFRKQDGWPQRQQRYQNGNRIFQDHRRQISAGPSIIRRSPPSPARKTCVRQTIPYRPRIYNLKPLHQGRASQLVKGLTPYHSSVLFCSCEACHCLSVDPFKLLIVPIDILKIRPSN